VTIDNRDGGQNGDEKKKKQRKERVINPDPIHVALAVLAIGGSLVHKCYL